MISGKSDGAWPQILWEFADGTSIEGDLETASVDLFPATLEYVKPFGQLDESVEEVELLIELAAI